MGTAPSSLTDQGRTLLEPVRALGAWAQANGEVIHRAREQYDAAVASAPAAVRPLAPHASIPAPGASGPG